MVRYFFSLTFVLLSILSFGKEHTLTVRVTNLPATDVILSQLKGDRQTIIDTIKTSAKGEISYQFTKNFAKGMYSLALQNMPLWKFIYNNETIEAEVELGAPMESARIIQSNENTSYYSFLRTQNKLGTQLELVQSVMEQYPVSEEYYSQSVAEFTRLQQAIEANYGKVMKGKATPLAKVYASTAKLVTIPLSVPHQFKKAYEIEHYFDFIPLQDTMVLYSDVFTPKLLEYFGLYTSPHASREENAKGYISAVDSILTKVLPQPTVYNFVANYLIDGFEGIGQEKVADFIAEQYAELNSCEKKDNMTAIETKVYNRTKLKIGSEAPHFTLSHNGETYTYKGEKDKTIILAFWATWCQHCTEVMPQAPRMLKKYTDQGVDVLTISLDTDPTQWKAFTDYYKMNVFKNFNPEGGWDAPIMVDYAVYGTPSFYIIKNGQIVAKPLDLQHVPTALSDILK